MPSRVGVVFVGTGGNKMVRALRSFRRTEPDLPVHIVFDTSTNTWLKNYESPPITYFESQPNVLVRGISNSGYINGAFNQAVRWIADLGYSHVCALHDDTVFSPLPENRYHLSEWFPRLDTDPDLRQASGLTLSFMEALVPSPILGHWQRSPEEWDARDLESDALWRHMLPDGKPALYFGSPGSEIGVQHSDWFVKYFATERTVPISRLGPSGWIIPIAIWQAIGEFGQDEGIYYDMEYPVTCILRGLPPVKVIPNTPHLHLHNQSTAYGDPAQGLWGRDLPSFIEKYGKEPGEILAEHGYYDYHPMSPGDLCPEPNLRMWLYGGDLRDTNA
jgi:hypothetical protein